MIRSPAPNLAPVPVEARSARHSPRGCLQRREAGATPYPPCGVAPPPVSTAASSPTTAGGHPLPFAGVAAVLTLFEGQAVFQVIAAAHRDLPRGALFRLRRGSRTHEPRWGQP